MSAIADNQNSRRSVTFAHHGVLPRRANQWFMRYPEQLVGVPMPEQISELVEISKLNGDFKRNYGKLIGAFLFLRVVSAARGRPLLWSGLLFALASTCVSWLARHGVP